MESPENFKGFRCYLIFLEEAAGDVLLKPKLKILLVKMRTPTGRATLDHLANLIEERFYNPDVYSSLLIDRQIMYYPPPFDEKMIGTYLKKKSRLKNARRFQRKTLKPLSILQCN